MGPGGTFEQQNKMNDLFKTIFLSFFVNDDLFLPCQNPNLGSECVFFLEDFGAKRTKPWKLIHITDTGLSFLNPSKALILSGFSSWLLLNESVSTQESL